MFADPYNTEDVLPRNKLLPYTRRELSELPINCLTVLFITELSSCTAVGSAYFVLTTEITCNRL